MRVRQRPRWQPRWSLALGALLCLGLCVVWNFTIDDAFITFRYAARLAHGQGLTWNSGQRVEGYTDFLWMLLMAAAEACGIPARVCAKILGVAALAVLIALLAGFGARYARHAPPWWPAAGLLFLPSSYYHAVSGLETVPYACVLFALYRCLMRAGERPRPAAALGAAIPSLGLAAALLRPEAVVPAAVAVVLGWRACGVGAFRRALALSAAAAAALGLAYFAWRWSFFGWPLPNTAYVKAAKGAEGLLATGALLRTYLPLFVLVAIGWAARPSRGLYPRSALFLAAVLLPYMAFRPVMDFSQRFGYPAIPVLLALSQVCLAEMGRRGVFPSAVRRLPAVSVLVVTLATSCYLPATYAYHLRNAHVALGKALAQAPVPAEWRSLSVGDAGAVSYYSHWRVLDWGGLNDVAIAHGLAPTVRILQFAPTVVFVLSHDGIRPAPASGLDIGKLLERYDVGPAVEFNTGYWLLALVRRDAPPEVTAAVDSAIAPVHARSVAANVPRGPLASMARAVVAVPPGW